MARDHLGTGMFLHLLWNLNRSPNQICADYKTDAIIQNLARKKLTPASDIFHATVSCFLNRTNGKTKISFGCACGNHEKTQQILLNDVNSKIMTAIEENMVHCKDHNIDAAKCCHRNQMLEPWIPQVLVERQETIADWDWCCISMILKTMEG